MDGWSVGSDGTQFNIPYPTLSEGRGTKQEFRHSFEKHFPGVHFHPMTNESNVWYQVHKHGLWRSTRPSRRFCLSERNSNFVCVVGKFTWSVEPNINSQQKERLYNQKDQAETYDFNCVPTHNGLLIFKGYSWYLNFRQAWAVRTASLICSPDLKDGMKISPYHD